MPYTSTTFKTYLITSLGDTAAFFGWTVDSAALDEVVLDVNYSLGVDDIADATNMLKARATGQYYVLMAALRHALTLYKFEVNGRVFDRAKVVDNIKAALSLAQSNPNAVITAEDDDNSFLISVTRVRHTDDPYSNERDPDYNMRPDDD